MNSKTTVYRKRFRTAHWVAAALLSSLLLACGQAGSQSRAVFVLVDISSNYANELQQAQTLSNYLLANLTSGDSLAIAFIDNSSFTERNIIARTTFDHRPSVTNQQKRVFRAELDAFIDRFRVPSYHSDITGGVLLAADHLNELEAGHKHLFILSDLHEDLPPTLNRDISASLQNVQVVAVNVKRQRSDNNNPLEYQQRLASWQQRIEESGGRWQLVNDVARLDSSLIR